MQLLLIVNNDVNPVISLLPVEHAFLGEKAFVQAQPSLYSLLILGKYSGWSVITLLPDSIITTIKFLPSKMPVLSFLAVISLLIK